MVNKREKPNVPGTWDAEQLRCTLFFQESPLSMDYEGLWDKLGNPDAEIVKQPKQNRAIYRLNQGVHTFAISIEIDRIHWTISSKQFRDEEVESSYLEIQDVFMEWLSPWLVEDEIPSPVRVAYGAVLHRPCKTKEEGYEMLQAFLPYVTLDSESSYDFSYQINRRRKSKAKKDIEYFNRLSAWSVARFTAMAIQVDDQGTKSIPLGSTAFSCRVALDINTPGENAVPINKKEIAELFDEFSKAGAEIAEYGDIS